ncbi:hypothetical protein FISHEDRAFT_47130 [Fistulina hepatica ATCC 64428]|uniref:Uncharacterized protein n=1 Tax=Fistulina hepatica ATCC 64428 TaxID=1128425 RepID=A0A0D7A6W4_9AGAR|nr:hypothetical protein FISHEDRAFT_47130 [Fistulina hepatica ATCC 64428]
MADLDNKARFQAEVSSRLAQILASNPSISPEEAMKQVTRDMLCNNPFVPPKGCPINDLPNEILAYIFTVGTEMDEEERREGRNDDDELESIPDDDGDSDWEDTDSGLSTGMTPDSDDHSPLTPDAPKEFVPGFIDLGDESDGKNDSEDGPELPFQVLVSHVCRHWRQCALECPSLWTHLTFSEPSPFERSRVYIKRSKGLPLQIEIDCTVPSDPSLPVVVPDSAPDGAIAVSVQADSDMAGPDSDSGSSHDHDEPPHSKEDLNAILDIIIPLVNRWSLFELSVNQFDHMYVALERLAQCPSAPELETLMLSHYEDCEEFSEFVPKDLAKAFVLFGGNAPKLKSITLWGVHVDWDGCASMFKDLHDLELAYHAEDVRPLLPTFLNMLRSSPELHNLSLCMSGPATLTMPSEESGEIYEFPTINELVLCYQPVSYIMSFMKKFCFPNVSSMVLDYDGEDYTEFAELLTAPMPGKSTSILAALHHLKIAGLPCHKASVLGILAQLTNLQSFNINCRGEEEALFFELLGWPEQQGSKPEIPASSSSSSSSKALYCPVLDTVVTQGIDGIYMRKFIQARKEAGSPLKKVSMAEDDELEAEDEDWIKANVEDFDIFEPSDDEDEDEDIEMDEDEITDYDVDEDEDAHWTGEMDIDE